MDVLEHGLEPWTFEDLMALPDSLWRYEVVDGSLLMTPPPGIRHEVTARRLASLLVNQVPDRFEVLGSVGVDIHPTYLIPDLVVIGHDAVVGDRDRAQPSELALVVEVVSPGSVSTDRILKPAKYAAAGIPNYWRIEMTPATSMTAYHLPDGTTTYTELGTWTIGQTAHLTEPFDLDIPVAALEP